MTRMRTKARLLGILLLTAAAVAAQTAPPPDIDPGAQPGQPSGPQDQAGPGVARISVLNGDASLRHGDAGDWVGAETTRREPDLVRTLRGRHVAAGLPIPEHVG